MKSVLSKGYDSEEISNNCDQIIKPILKILMAERELIRVSGFLVFYINGGQLEISMI